MDMEVKRAGFWKTTAILADDVSGLGLSWILAVRGMERIMMLPEVGRERPEIRRMKDDFPVPDGPITATASPRWMVREMSSRISLLP